MIAAQNVSLLRLLTLFVSTLSLAVAVLALPGSASADLPRKPACSQVTAKLLKSTFGSTFAERPTATEHRTGTVDHLRCIYSSLDGDLEIDYFRYSSDTAARAHFAAVKRSLIRRGNNQAIDTVTQLLPLVTVRGIGDMALRSTDGSVIEFVDGIDTVTIENGFADLSLQTTAKSVVFAKRVDSHG